MKKKIEEKPLEFEIELFTTFSVAHIHNVQNITLALAQAGYFINISHRDEFYQVLVFRHKK